MLRDGGGKAIEILMKLDIDLKQVKKRIESFLRDAEDDTLLPDADVPLSPMTAKILKMCILEARILKSATADAEHVLLAILKDGDNLAATVLEENRGIIKLYLNSLQCNLPTRMLVWDFRKKRKKTMKT